MAHQVKYYKEIASHGHLWRLEIWQDIPVNEENGKPTHILTPVEIGPVLQSLRLVVQGDQADVDTPIVKTSLEMSFVDAPGLEYERKCGYWEEFYTSSATEYQVKLYKDNILEWTGYVTPDSFAEDLRYRGSVNIIARDNLGTLQDSNFDMLFNTNIDDKVYIDDLLRMGYSKSACPMELVISDDYYPKAVAIDAKTSASGNLLNQMVDIRAFKDANWLKAVEDVMYSAGLVLRYIGGNKIQVMPIRDIPKAGAQYWWDVPVKDVSFLAYGRRELIPAVKSIKEVVEYDVDTEQDGEGIEDYVPNQSANYQCQNIVLSGPTSTTSSPMNVPVHGYKKNRINQYLMPESSCLLDVSAYPKVAGEDSEEYGQWDDKSIIYFAINGNPSDIRPVQFIRKIHSADAKIGIHLTADKPVSVLANLSGVLNTPIEKAREYGTSITLEYRLMLTDAVTGQNKYYNGNSWVSSEYDNYISLDNGLISVDKPNPSEFKREDITVPSAGTLTMEIRRIGTTVVALDLRKDCAGMYLRLKDIGIDVKIPEDAKILSKVTLTTEYQDKYAVRLTRSPELGVNPTSAPEVAYIPNAILAECKSQYVGAEQWVWPLGRTTLPSTGISLSRLIHQELLAYHAKPNNVLTGELFDAGGEVPDFCSLWRWNGKLHTLMSGTLNILTGRMESAVLREFTRYDHMWETWVENEDILADFPNTPITFYVHSKRQLDLTSWGEDIPEWIFLNSDAYNADKGCYEFRLTVMENKTGYMRTAQFTIDTAWVRIRQRSAGDYGVDYGEDYA
jgi:hypothetical protein